MIKLQIQGLDSEVKEFLDYINNFKGYNFGEVSKDYNELNNSAADMGLKYIRKYVSLIHDDELAYEHEQIKLE